MSMTVVVTRNVSPRVRGFLASVMLEVAPGVYTNPRMSPAVRERVWSVLQQWLLHERDASAVLLWQDREMPCGQAVKVLGSPPIEIVEVDGLLLSRRALPGA